MENVAHAEFFEDLKFFRWTLYHHGRPDKIANDSSNSDSESENGSDSDTENTSTVSIESDDITESEEIIGSLIRYHCDHGHGEIIAEELLIAKYGLEKNLHEVLRSIAPHIDESQDLPSIRNKNDELWDLNRLFICLVYENKELFVKGLELIGKKRPDDLCTLLVSIEFLLIQISSKINTDSACEILTSALDKLSSLQDDAVNGAIKEHDRCLLELKKTKPGKNEFCIVDLIESAKQKLCCHEIRNSNIKKYINHEQCLDVLIDWDDKVVFECDKHSQTALHYAIRCKNYEAIKKLLNKGAYIGMDGKRGHGKQKKTFNIQRLSPKVLEEHFDSCISVREDHIEIDFKNLIAPSDHRSKRLYPHDMNIIEFMSDSTDYKHLIVHPLISSFVMLKWNRLANFIYTDFAQHFILMIMTIIYVLKGDTIIFSFFKLNWLKYYIWVLVAYLVVRRIGQQIFWRGRKTRYNLLQCLRTLFIVISLSLVLVDFSRTNREIFGTIAILSTSVEAFIEAGSLFWSFSKYYIMFLDVAWNSIKSLQLCVIALPAFAASFNLLYRDPLLIERESACQLNDTCDLMNDAISDVSISQSPFSRFDSSLLKIIVMSTGEFEASASNFDLNVMTLALLLCFVFLIATVFMNLMNGLAVGDTQKIQSNAEVVCMQQRCRILARFEDIFSKQLNWITAKFPHVNDILEEYILESSIKENPIAFLQRPLNTKIYISPSRRVIIAKNRYKGYSYRCGNSFEDENVKKLYSWVSTHTTLSTHKSLQMDRKILHDIRLILDRKSMEQNGDNGKDHVQCQIANLETDVEKVVEMMKENEKNTGNRFEEVLDLLRKMHEENRKCHEEIANLKSFIISSQGSMPGPSSLKPNESKDLRHDDE